MEKIILSIILASSASSSLLVAENENRQEATNQVTGCRLQDKNRLKAIGYRLEEEKNQRTGEKMAELPSDLSFQIGQGVKTTTNYELPTANCDNNQATGYRLQTTGSKTAELPSEDKISQRTKTTTNYELRTANCDNNQATGYRLQTTGSKTAELPSEDKISQRTKTTTNYELRTTNCDNSNLDLSCHLSMDPAELKNIEEGVEIGRAHV